MMIYDDYLIKEAVSSWLHKKNAIWYANNISIVLKIANNGRLSIMYLFSPSDQTKEVCKERLIRKILENQARLADLGRQYIGN